MKFLHIVLTLDTPLYREFNRYKKAYYDEIGHDVIFVYNGTDKSLHKPDEGLYNYFHNNPGNGIPVMLLKFMQILQEPIIANYDIIVRENASTFLNMGIIEKLDLSKDFLYGGYFEPQWNFVSGMATFFNRDTLKTLQIWKDELDYTIYDDVAIGNVLLNHGVGRTFIDRYNISERVDCVDDEELQWALEKPQIRIRNDRDRWGIDLKLWSRILQAVK